MKNYHKYLKLFIFVICLGFITYTLFNNIEILNDLKQNKAKIFILVFISIAYVNIVIFRSFLFLTGSVKYTYSFLDWSKLYCECILLNVSLPLSGLIYKGIQLKKRSINYTQYIAISYFLMGTYISISMFLVLLETLFIQKVFSFFIISLIGLIIFLIYLSTIILKVLVNYMMKFKRLKKYIKSFDYLIKALNNSYEKKKALSILFLNTIIVHAVEVIMFYMICNFFLDNVNIQVILGLFVASFILDRIPFVSEIPGISEIILGLLFLPLGLYFADGIIIKLTLRIINYISILFNSGVYFVLSFYDKNKFIH